MNPNARPLVHLNKSDCWDVKAYVPIGQSLVWRTRSAHDGEAVEIVAIDPERKGVVV